jgi:hypothetical protein
MTRIARQSCIVSAMRTSPTYERIPVKRHAMKKAGLTAFALLFSCSMQSVSADFVYTWTIAPELWGQVEQKTITFDIPAVEGEGSPTLYNIEITAVQFNPQLKLQHHPVSLRSGHP